MLENRFDSITDRWFVEELQANPELLSPLSVGNLERPGTTLSRRAGGTAHFGFDLDLKYRGRTFRFAVDVKGRSAPMIVRAAVEELRTLATGERLPMLAVPHLTADVQELVKQGGLSAIDANGNYLILTPDLVAIRLDQPNRFPESKSIRNIYSGNSSIVGRFLLREPDGHRQVNDIANGIERRGGGVSLATVSKVLAGLVDDLIVVRRPGSIALADASALLRRLEQGYRRPKNVAVLRLKLPGNSAGMADILTSVLGQGQWIWDGTTSAIRYASTTPQAIVSAYARASRAEIDRLRTYEESRFFNCEIRTTGNAFVYFDADGPWASIVQTYLELMGLDKREREIADDIRERILRPTL